MRLRNCPHVRPNQLGRVPLLPQSRPTAAAPGVAQLHHHMELRVSRARTQHYLRLLTRRRAPYACPTEVSTAVILVLMPTAKRHGILMKIKIPYVLQ